MKKLATVSLSIIASVYLFALPVVVSADTCPAGAVCITNPLGQANTFCRFLKEVLNVALELGTPIIIVFLVVAGARFVFAKGNSQALQKARENLLYTMIGIGIFLGAYTLAMVVSATINTLQTSTGNPTGTAC